LIKDAIEFWVDSVRSFRNDVEGIVEWYGFRHPELILDQLIYLIPIIGYLYAGALARRIWWRWLSVVG